MESTLGVGGVATALDNAIVLKFRNGF
jgi:hypothetical protein